MTIDGKAITLLTAGFSDVHVLSPAVRALVWDPGEVLEALGNLATVRLVGHDNRSRERHVFHQNVGEPRGG